MAFDINEVLSGMIGAVSGVLTAEWPKIQTCFQLAINNERDAIESISKARIQNEIDDDEMKSQLDDEKAVLMATLLACKVKGKAAAQKAANAAIKVLSDSIKAGLIAL